MTPYATLIGWGPFASAWMLLWLGAAAIPLVIHLLSRRTRTVTQWAAIGFLQAALHKHARRLRIEQLLLLLLRTSILILLAVALAEPIVAWLPVTSPVTRSRGRTHTVLVVDGSYSMGYNEGERSRFDIAKEQAWQLVTQGIQGDGFSLVVMADPPRSVVGDVAFDRNDVQQEIENLELTHGGARLAETLDLVQRIIQSAKTRYPRLVQHRVCFFTDLGRTTWDGVSSTECLDRIKRFAENETLLLSEIGETGTANLAIVRLATDRHLPIVNGNVTLEVELQEFAGQERLRQRVELLVDGRSVAEDFVSLAPARRATTSFVHQFDAAGEHVVEARIDGDPLDVDNQRWLSIPIREAIRALCVQGKQDAARFVSMALAPAENQRSRIQPEIAAENALVEIDLNEYDCIWLCNVGRFDREEANLLHRYVRRGGGLIVALGDQVQAENYNQELGGELSGNRVLPARLGQLVGGSLYAFNPLDYEHPILAPFRGHERAGLLTTPVWRYYRLKPYDAKNSKTAMKFDRNGDPALVEESIGQGRSTLMATAVSLSSQDESGNPWTALPVWPSFPPLVQAMLQEALRGRAQGRNVVVGEPLVATLPNSVTEDAAVTVLDPLQREQRVPVRIDGPDRRWYFEETTVKGVYQAAFGQLPESQQLYAANINTRESDLARFDRGLLPSQFGDPLAVDDTATAATAPSNGGPLFRLILALVLTLLFGESVLAWRLGSEF